MSYTPPASQEKSWVFAKFTTGDLGATGNDTIDLTSKEGDPLNEFVLNGNGTLGMPQNKVFKIEFTAHMTSAAVGAQLQYGVQYSAIGGIPGSFVDASMSSASLIPVNNTNTTVSSDFVGVVDTTGASNPVLELQGTNTGGAIGLFEAGIMITEL